MGVAQPWRVVECGVSGAGQPTWSPLEFESVSLGGGAGGSLVRLRDLILREMDSERVCAWPRGVAEAPAGGVPKWECEMNHLTKK